ncbi:Cof-type HAD-IIB family hydrolase [Nonomuraea sp. NPDC050310]|uniref:Cof-type HAD-IIB family hydrolase n=1 Tax=Nonomuraea sp. NPDC050310 TaxID=3154935 RepID=UPI0033D09603
MTAPRLVATDLDGTLLDSARQVSPRTRAALQRAAAAGAQIVIITARPPRNILAIAEQAGVGGLALCSNGALRYDLTAKTVTAASPLEPATVGKLRDLLREALPDPLFAIETGHGVLMEPGYPVLVPEDAPNRRHVADLWAETEPVAKLLVRCEGHTSDELFTAATAAVGELAEITYSGISSVLEISAPGVTKATALAALCAELGIAPEQVVAFGDMPNDLAVLAFAGHGYAMANSHPSVLAAIPRHTLSNDEDGVAAVLETLYS